MSNFNVGTTVEGANQGAETGYQFGGPWGAAIGAVIGGVTGGVLGSKSKKKRKTAARVAREVRAIERMQARKTAIIEAIQTQAVAKVAGYSEGYNPEGTSSAIGIQQSIYSQAQSGLKTEGQIFGRQEKIERLTSQADSLDNTFAMLKSLAKTAGDIKGGMAKK